MCPHCYPSPCKSSFGLTLLHQEGAAWQLKMHVSSQFGISLDYKFLGQC